MKFKNNLHEFDTSYYYEIFFKILVSKVYLNDHIYLFTNSSKRSSQKILLSSTFTFSSSQFQISSAEHVCCIISRFRTNHNSISHSEVLLSTIDFQDQNFSDFSIIVRDKIFFTHKFMLASKSDVFKAMFSHKMLESEEGIIKIDDFSAEAVKEFLQYIYTNKAKNLSILSVELYKLAHKYQVEGLKDICLEDIIFNVNCQNAVEIFDLVSLYDLSVLKEKLISFMSSREEKMVQSMNYREYVCRNFSVETISDVLQLCYKYPLDDVKEKAFEFVKNNSEVAKNDKFLDFFRSNPTIAQDLYVHEKLAGSKTSQKPKKRIIKKK